MDIKLLRNKLEREGQKFKSKYSGEIATLTEYRHSHDVTITFDNGVTKDLSFDRVRRGDFRDTTKPTVHGYGIKDVDYEVEHKRLVDGKRKTTYICPYYKLWRGVLNRTCCESWKKKSPTYRDCTVAEEWQYLSNFINWVDSQPVKNWRECQLDKDIIVTHNKKYSPETCAFVNGVTNCFVTDNKASRGDLPLGVCWHIHHKKYHAKVQNPFTSKREHLGYFQDPIAAHDKWKTRKHELACELAKTQSDPRIAEALRKRYAPETNWLDY